MRALSLVGGQEANPFPGHELSNGPVIGLRAGIAEPWELAGWVAEIKQAWSRGASGTMPLAQTLARAKAKLRHGAWAKLWHTKEMPLGKRKAEILVAVGKVMGDLNAHDPAHLPLAWLTLYILTALSRPLIEQLVAEGQIHPRVTLIDAQKRVTEFQALTSPRISPVPGSGSASPALPTLSAAPSPTGPWNNATSPLWNSLNCSQKSNPLNHAIKYEY